MRARRVNHLIREGVDLDDALEAAGINLADYQASDSYEEVAPADPAAQKDDQPVKPLRWDISPDAYDPATDNPSVVALLGEDAVKERRAARQEESALDDPYLGICMIAPVGCSATSSDEAAAVFRLALHFWVQDSDFDFAAPGQDIGFGAVLVDEQHRVQMVLHSSTRSLISILEKSPEQLFETIASVNGITDIYVYPNPHVALDLEAFFREIASVHPDYADIRIEFNGLTELPFITLTSDPSETS